MYAYNLYWNANKSMLLYPSSRQVDESFGNYWKGREINELNQCKIGFAKILDENLQLNFDVGNQILSKLFLMANSRLSKSTFIRGLQCEKSLFLYKHHYKLKDPISPSLQSIFDQGTSIGLLAQELFP